MMTTNEWKLLKMGAAFVVLIGGFLLVLIVAVVGLSLFVLSAADPASGSEKKTTRKASSEEPDAPAGRLAPQLVGTWYTSAGGGETDFTGKSRYRSNRRQMYRITADGRVEYTFERETLTIMQCEIKERKTAYGKAASDEETLTINFGETDYAGSNSCEGGETEEKTLPAETRQLTWRFKEEMETTRLCFDEADGEVCYDKKD